MEFFLPYFYNSRPALALFGQRKRETGRARERERTEDLNQKNCKEKIREEGDTKKLIKGRRRTFAD